MNRTLAIAGITLRLLVRNGSALALILLASALGAGIFAAARGDGTLAHELQMRLRYGLYFVTGLLNFALMYIGCISLRRDLDQRQFHLMAAAPVRRAQIWIGKYLGIMALGTGVYLCASLVLAGCCLVFVLHWERPEERAALRDSFLQAWAVHRPDQPPMEDLVEREFRKRFAEWQHDHEKGDHDHEECSDPGHHHGEPEWLIKRELVKDIRRELQIVPPDAAKTWRFKLDSREPSGDEIRLRGKFYTERKRILVHGSWELAAPGEPPTWTGEFSGYPYMAYDVRIPRTAMPPGPVVELTFRGRGAPFLIFPIGEAEGIRLLTAQGTIVANYFRLLGVTLLHLGLLLALALALAAMFSYSVAVFVTLAMYFMSMAADSFLSAMRFQAYSEQGPAYAAIRIGIQLARGLKSPAAIEPFVGGIALPLADLMAEWGIAAIATTAAIAAFGMFILARKEIDKLLQS
jgi:hypothetical protein